MAQVLYRKYRSKKLSEIVGQEHITKTLSEALKSKRLSHAYLFTGPRGVGKTSVARILAHEINQLPYTDDKPHIDIIEIDAASNRRIDEIRDLREKVHTLPTSANYKVYIIDEVHMLTNEAFNALLKTLEEPPKHVIFILATTDPQKLPDTIVSRTQRFSFKPIDATNTTKHLRLIANNENIKITDQALELIAEHGEGSFRDSISLLDQLSHGQNEITEDKVRQILGIPPKEATAQLVNLIDSQNASFKELTDLVNSLIDQGYSPSIIARNLMADLRDKLVNNQLQIPASQAIHLLKELLRVDTSTDQASFLLLCLIDALSAQQRPLDHPPSASIQPTKKPKTDNQKPINQKVAKKTIKIQKLTEANWADVLNELKQKYNTLYGIVRMAQPNFKDDQLDLVFDFSFHQKQVSEAKNKQIIANIIENLTGRQYKIECLLNDDAKSTANNSKPANNQSTKDLDAINKIFGGGELVE